MPQSAAITNLLLRLALALMCVLNFESCALVRQRTKRESLHQKQYEHHESIIKKELCDSLFRSLQISFDSVEIICYDSASSVPSPMVKVRATKATVSKQTQQIVTQCERTAECDSIMAEITKGAIEGRSNAPPQKKHYRGFAVIAIVIAVLTMFVLMKKK